MTKKSWTTFYLKNKKKIETSMVIRSPSSFETTKRCKYVWKTRFGGKLVSASQTLCTTIWKWYSPGSIEEMETSTPSILRRGWVARVPKRGLSPKSCRRSSTKRRRRMRLRIVLRIRSRRLTKLKLNLKTSRKRKTKRSKWLKNQRMNFLRLS
jgi:hypothetical protein